MVFTMTACSSSDDEASGDGVVYTYNTYASSLGTAWNPHTWETSADSLILDYVTTPLVTYSIDDSEEGSYQWVFKAATSITDVTAEHQDLLTTYDVNLNGKSADEVTSQYIFQIDLNPDMAWETGEMINADDYVESMKRLLDPEMKNYRANLFYDGEYAIAGGSAYYYSDQEGYYVALSSLGYSSVQEAVDAGVEVYIDVVNFWGVTDDYTDADGNVAPDYVSITDTTVYGENVGDAYSGADLMANYGSYLEVGGDYDSCIVAYAENEDMGATFDSVGLIKVDDYTLLYVMENEITYEYFLYSMTSTWLVHCDTYDAGYDTTGTLKTTDYGTSAETTVSCGAYVLSSYESDKQMIFTKNPYYYAFEEDESGRLVGTSDYLVDGNYVEVYQTDKIVVDVMTDDSAKQAFMKGELDSWYPSSDDLPSYSLSDQMYKAPETYSMTFFMHTNLEDLQTMDTSYGNTNSVVLSNITFRKAFSLSIDRAEFVTATAGYEVAFGLISDLYYYDIWNDPTSVYRESDAAKRAIVEFYEIEYGEGTAYATLDEAYDSVTGYNLTQAQELMAQACAELVADGLYTEGEDIYIRIAYSAGSIDSSIQQQTALLNEYINAAAEGSGFGTITFEAVGNITGRYAAVRDGEYAIGWGGWGGAAFDPFTKFQVFMDTDKYGDQVSEVGCYDPTTETVTLNILGTDYTMTWQAWSNSMSSGGLFYNESYEVKLEVLAALEKAFLEQYYDIPICTTTSCEMLSYQCSYYTNEYNIMYGFGGIELMTYNYTDAEWTEYVSSQGGTLSYE